MSQQVNSVQTYSATQIQSWLTENLAQQLGIEADEIDVTEPLDSYGLDSAQAMLIMSKAQKLLQFEFSPILLWHYPTIESLAERLAEECANSDTEVFEI